MSYVPPHLRNRKIEKKNEMPKIVESEFPEFGSGPRPANFKRPSFISKLKEETKNINIPERETASVVYRRHHFTFGKSDVEEEEEDESESEPQTVPKTEDDGWQTVERKIRVKKDKIQEALDNEDGEVEEEESAWDEQPEEYETYWDERKH
jgi:NACalpha-BTF3-like transcription factor